MADFHVETRDGDPARLAIVLPGSGYTADHPVLALPRDALRDAGWSLRVLVWDAKPSLEDASDVYATAVHDLVRDAEDATPLVLPLNVTSTPTLLVGGTADPLWDSAAAAQAAAEVMEVPGGRSLADCSRRLARLARCARGCYCGGRRLRSPTQWLRCDEPRTRRATERPVAIRRSAQFKGSRAHRSRRQPARLRAFPRNRRRSGGLEQAQRRLGVRGGAQCRVARMTSTKPPPSRAVWPGQTRVSRVELGGFEPPTFS